MTRGRWWALAALVVILVLAGRYLVWIDLANRCVIRIRPSLVGYDNTMVKRALDTLRHGSPADYRNVCIHVATINPNPACGGFGGGCFWHHEGQKGRATIDISTEHGLIWTVAIIVHETGPAGYPYEVVRGSWGRENFDIQDANGNADRAKVEAWMTLDRAKELFSAAGQDFDALKKTAITKDFKPVALNAKATFHLKNTLRKIDSQNVIAKLEGSDPKLKDEYVIYTAHWDHLGKDDNLPGDKIYNGAIDNASGVATLLEIAEAFTKLQTPPKRTILFLAVTGEEKGLLGSKYYAEHPLYPLDKTLAEINKDGVNQWGRTRDITLIGLGNSTLDDITRDVAAMQGRTIAPDPEPEKGYFYRSDHFEFAKQGVPALDPESGIDYVGKPAGFGKQKRDEYTSNDYHKPSDEVKPDWDLTGAIEDAQLLFMVGHNVAQGDKYPEWKPGTEFKAKRDAMLKGTGAS